jgi:hypothetical protein
LIRQSFPDAQPHRHHRLFGDYYPGVRDKKPSAPDKAEANTNSYTAEAVKIRVILEICGSLSCAPVGNGFTANPSSEPLRNTSTFLITTLKRAKIQSGLRIQTNFSF